jgi:hypothetical protein
MALQKVNIDLYIYTGTAGSYVDSDLKYSITKERISSQDNIVVEVGQLVRDYIDQTFNNDYLSQCVWASAVVEYIDEDTGVAYLSGSPQIFTYLAVDGYGYFEDEINPELERHALITTNNIYLPENTNGRLPIFAEGVGKVTIGGSDTQITDSGNTNQKLQYVTVASDSGTVLVYDTDDTTLLKTITVNEVCEPKYNPYKVTFVNKYGAYQDIHFFKRTNETLQVTDKNYKRNIINQSTVSYNTYDGQRERYEVNGITSLQLNTGFVKEDFNSALEELFLSEYTWIRWEGKTLPVMPKSKSMNFKTSLNDKLINYTVDFEFAFNKINNVR